MLRRFAQYFFSFAVLGIACAIYQLTFVKWVEPAPLPAIEMASSPVLRTDDTLTSMFGPDSWQRGNCMRLLTRDGVLLFENLKQISDDQWKLWPVTVVIGPKGRSPLILEAIQGAEIKFTEPLDVMSGGAPPIELGRMIGNVKIHNFEPNPSSESIRADGKQQRPRRLVIEASEVGIDHQKVWTTQPILLQIGDVKVTGRDLTLHLATAGGIVAAGDDALSILDRLELIYLDELSVPLASGGLWGDSYRTTPTAVAPKIRRPVPIAQPSTEIVVEPAPGLATLRCGGRVIFQFGTGELTLEDGVELRHQASTRSAVLDTFVCEDMMLRFSDLLAKRQRSDKLQDYLLSMVAQGRQGRPARASLPGLEAELSAGTIELDTRANLVRMGGGTGVLVSYAGNRWQFGQINYLFNPTDPKELGTFDAIGPGGMDVASRLEVPVNRLQWSGGVKLEKAPGSDQVSLRMDGDVRALTSDGGTFECDSARLLMQQIFEEQSGAPDAIRSGSSKVRLVPKQFQATGAVKLETPVMAVATRLLQLYFEVEPKPRLPDSSSDANAAESDGLPRGWLRQPGDDRSTTKLAANATPVTRARPSIHGDTINAKLWLDGGAVSAQDLTVVGNVSLRHEIETAGGPLPAVLTGDRLLLSNGGENDILQIGSGVDRPARFDLGDGFFVGPLIQVRLADNVVWIKDAGEFRLPTQVLPRVGSIGSRGRLSPMDSTDPNEGIGRQPRPTPSSIEWVNAPTCRWSGQMIFDGRTAVLSGGVNIHATLISGSERDEWDLQVAGDQLQLVLDQGVSIRNVESTKSAKVDQVSITSSAANPLLITANQLTASGLRKARHVLAAPQLTMTPDTGLLSGPGPGWYRAWTQSNPTPQFAEISNEPEASMFGIHLSYEHALNADLNQQSLEFINGIRIAGRRVQAWDELIDVAKIQGLRLGESTLDCDRLRLAIDSTQSWVPASSAWEMESIGNVAFQTRIERGLFSGTANRASYSAAKDLFLIEGTPGRAAALNHTLPTGQPGFSVSGDHMSANPKTMELQNGEFRSIQLGTLPGALNK